MISCKELSLTPAGFGYHFGLFASAIPTMPGMADGRLILNNPDANYELATQRSLISFDASAATAAEIHRGIDLPGVGQPFGKFVRDATELQDLLGKRVADALDSDFARWVESSGAAGVPIRNSRSVPPEISSLGIRKIARIMAKERDPAVASHVWTLGVAFSKLAEKASEWKGESLVYSPDFYFRSAALFAMLTDERAMNISMDRFLESANLLMKRSEYPKAGMVGDLALDAAERVPGLSPGRSPSKALVAEMWLEASKRLEYVDPRGFVICMCRGLKSASECQDVALVEKLLGAASVFYSGHGAFREAAAVYVRMAAVKFLNMEMDSESWAAVAAYLSMAENQAGKAMGKESLFYIGQVKWLRQQAQRLAGSTRFSVIGGVNTSGES